MRKMKLKTLAAALIWAALGAPSGAQTCRDLTFEDATHTVCEVSASQDLRLFWRDRNETTLGNFGRINQHLAPEGRELVFAMNAGMYHSDRSPVGLYIENGIEHAPLITASGPGNFGMTPNGVFCVGHEGAFAVYESRSFGAKRPACRFATQSGPMLVIEGALHPRFLVDSDSRYIRNGVGVSADGKTAYFLFSSSRVTFHEFARIFRDVLNTPNALYFDGNISRLHAPEVGRSDFGFPMGPVVGLTKAKE